MTFKINHKNSPVTGGKLGVFWGVYIIFDHIFVGVISNTALNWTAKYRVDSSTVDVIFLLNLDIDIIIF